MILLLRNSVVSSINNSIRWWNREGRIRTDVWEWRFLLNINSAKLPRWKEVYTKWNRISNFQGFLYITWHIQIVKSNISNAVNFQLGANVSMIVPHVLNLSVKALLKQTILVVTTGFVHHKKNRKKNERRILQDVIYGSFIITMTKSLPKLPIEPSTRHYWIFKSPQFKTTKSSN